MFLNTQKQEAPPPLCVCHYCPRRTEFRPLEFLRG